MFCVFRLLYRTLASVGMVDVFCERHLALGAFTFYTRGGSASRLDYIFAGGPFFSLYPPINTLVIWQCERRVDNDPVVADFLFRLSILETPHGPSGFT